MNTCGLVIIFILCRDRFFVHDLCTPSEITRLPPEYYICLTTIPPVLIVILDKICTLIVAAWSIVRTALLQPMFNIRVPSFSRADLLFREKVSFGAEKVNLTENCDFQPFLPLK